MLKPVPKPNYYVQRPIKIMAITERRPILIRFVCNIYAGNVLLTFKAQSKFPRLAHSHISDLFSHRDPDRLTDKPACYKLKTEV